VPGEFDLITRYFARPTHHTALGVGDDGALIRPTPGHDLVVSSDMLVEGTHFLSATNARDLGWKTLAVNISDMAAMGARPRWATLALALPSADALWLGEFSSGFFECADAFEVDLIGGDTTRGPLCLSVTILGEVPAGKALRRDGARVGDDIWVSGAPGRAALGLAHAQGRITLDEPARSECTAALQRPQPRVALGLALRGIASAAIDVSDGLLADLGHILERSKVSATLRYAVPPAPTFTPTSFLAGGDDYELVFTASPSRRSEIESIGDQLGVPLTRLGSITTGTSATLSVVDAIGNNITPPRRGFDHFR
jgi:thiamine-monophosphate kinase